jgi:hypothetical protein
MACITKTYADCCGQQRKELVAGHLSGMETSHETEVTNLLNNGDRHMLKIRTEQHKIP